MLCSIKVTEQPTQCFINFNQVNGYTVLQLADCQSLQIFLFNAAGLVMHVMRKGAQAVLLLPIDVLIAWGFSVAA